MKKADFVWTVGYQGNVALINGSRRREVPEPDAIKLLEEGALRPALCAALWEQEKDGKPLDRWLEAFVSKTGLNLSENEVKRLLGVYQLPPDSTKVKIL